jgi:hypothetical protein
MICTRQTASAALTVNNRSPPPAPIHLLAAALMLEGATRLRSTETASHHDFVVLPPAQSSPHEKQKVINDMIIYLFIII